MATNEEIYNALVLLQKECELLMDNQCVDCNIEKACGYCPFIGGFTKTKLKKPRRFTDTDILWAKAAKESGAKKVKRGIGLANKWASACTYESESIREMVLFPTSAFRSLDEGETVPIDDILKEEE